MPTAYQNRILADGATAYFPLDDPAGSVTAKDMAGTRSGTLTGTIVTGVPGAGNAKAMQFIGSGLGQIEVIPSIPLVVRPTPFSVELWYLIAAADQNSGNDSYLITIGKPDDGIVGSNGTIAVWMTGDDYPMEGLSMNQANAYMDENFEQMVTPDQWHHLVGTYAWGVEDGVGGTLTLYRDGVLLSQREVWEDPSDLPTSPPWMTVIGNVCFGPTSFTAWTGLLQDVAFYQQELTPTTVSEHYDLRLRVIPPPPPPPNTLVDVSFLGWGGSGIPDVLPQAVGELQRLSMNIVEGMGSGQKIVLVPMRSEDVIVAIMDLSMAFYGGEGDQVTVDAKATPVYGGFTCKESLDFTKLLVWWYDKVVTPKPPPRPLSMYQQKIVADGAKWYWPLDDEAGALTAREVANGAGEGVLFGDITAGILGLGTTVMEFGASKGYISVPDVPLTSQFSVEAWIKPEEEWVTAASRIATEYSGIQHGGGWWSALYQSYPGPVPNRFTYGWIAVEGQTQTALYSPANMPLSVWYHLVSTHDGITAKLFVNNVLVDSSVSPLAPDNVAMGYRTLIGGIQTQQGVGYQMSGQLSDVAIYAKALTPQTIAAHYALRLA